MDISGALDVSASGLDAQSERLRVISENMANEDTTGSTPGADPYRRKIITFAEQMDRETGESEVTVKSISRDQSPFGKRYDPSHPAADASGYVKTSNVSSFIEMMDMREAERSYSANLDAMQATRSMMTRTIDLLK
ncbi:flagellar basal body rod protein FlgC [Acetobacteraceae bacterium KSS8]|uniref:Flagellar basal-body rod protein FlgC n=1 Tax=Endosaccharibacter trunci TaxID=2812733 RepID=A0ABT1W9E6_9PROT|nr:flagellar basal body rod protein FlgC [Acetobacteraceae bacterium KSS8]